MSTTTATYPKTASILRMMVRGSRRSITTPFDPYAVALHLAEHAAVHGADESAAYDEALARIPESMRPGPEPVLEGELLSGSAVRVLVALAGAMALGSAFDDDVADVLILRMAAAHAREARY